MVSICSGSGYRYIKTLARFNFSEFFLVKIWNNSFLI